MIDILPSYSALLRLTGPDTITLLERLVTCRTDDLSTGEQRPGALLTPQGKIIADFHLTRTEAGCDLLVHSDAAANLAKRLKMFRLRADVDITQIEVPIPSTDQTTPVEGCQPAYGKDFVDSEVFPTDVNLDIRGGIDYKKGCFVGQEVVSRMMRRGKIRKRTVCLNGENLSKGEAVMAGGKRLGQITSASHANAFAVLRIDHLAEALAQDVLLTSGGTAITPELARWHAGRAFMDHHPA